MATLRLEKRGCDFSPNDERVRGSDIGNHRVCTGDFSIPAKNGRTYHIEFGWADKWQTRYTNKRTGKPLAHPVRELVAPCVAHLTACFRDEDGCCWGDSSLWHLAWDDPKPYTERGILDIVNAFAAVPYDRIEYVS